MDIPENPKAFPGKDLLGAVHGGITLRDYFAAAALTGIMADPAVSLDEPHQYTAIASQSYGLADAMLKAREAKPN